MERRAAVFYPGEMGCAVAAALADDGWEVYTHLWGKSLTCAGEAAAAAVRDLPSLEEALSAAELAVSLVPPAAALESAVTLAAAAVRCGARPLFLEANSVAPETAREVARTVEGAGLTCVDGAFVGSAADLGRRTRLYLSGEGADELAAALPEPLRPTTLGPSVGAASAFKLAFAGFNKGLVALFLKVMAAGEATGDPGPLLACLAEFYPGTVETLARLLPSYPRHAARRADEMGELAGWLRSEGLDEAWALVAGEEFTRFADLELDADRVWSLEELLDAWSTARRGAPGPR